MSNQTESKDVWVFIEQEEGVIADVSLELLAKEQELAGRLNSQVCGLLCGHQVEGLAEMVIHHGADRVLLADHPELENYRTLPYARVASDLVRERQPYIFLMGASPIGRDLAPRIASSARAGLTADCTDLQIGDYTAKKDKQVYTDLLYQIRPAFGGNLIATIINPTMHPQNRRSTTSSKVVRATSTTPPIASGSTCVVAKSCCVARNAACGCARAPATPSAEAPACGRPPSARCRSSKYAL